MTVLSLLKHCISKLCKCCSICSENDTLPDSKWKNSSQNTNALPRTRSNHGLTLQIPDPYVARRDSTRQPSTPFLCCNSDSQSPIQSTPYFSPTNMLHPPTLKRVPSMSDTDFTMPEMSGYSSVLSQYQVSALFLTFPPRLRLYPWTLLYSISRDGCSLNNLYSKLANYEYTLLILILDTRRAAFGAVLSPPNLKLQGKVYSGTPETFVFTFFPKLRKFHASGENNYFVQSMPDGVSIGGWRPAIWIDSNLEKGTTDCSATFENLPLTTESFVIRELECWALTEPEYMEDIDIPTKSTPIYQYFPSSILATKKPEMEVGGVRCGKRSRKYKPTWKPDKGERMFCVGEESEDEESEDIARSVEESRRSNLPYWNQGAEPRRGEETSSSVADSYWSSIYL